MTKHNTTPAASASREQVKQSLASFAKDLEALGRSIANAGHAAAGHHCEFNSRLAVAVIDVDIERAQTAIRVLTLAKELILLEAKQ